MTSGGHLPKQPGPAAFERFNAAENLTHRSTLGFRVTLTSRCLRGKFRGFFGTLR